MFINVFWRDFIIKPRSNYADDVAKYLGDHITKYQAIIFTFSFVRYLVSSPPIGGGRGIVMPMSVCLFVCVFVCVCVCLSVFSQNFKV